MSTRTIGLSDTLHRYLLSVSVREHPVQASLREVTAALGGPARMQISPEQGQFMGLLVRMLGARRIVEVGTFTGYSALSMTLALPADGQITCCDVSEEWTAIARDHWARAGVSDRIDLRIAPALQTLDDLLEAGAAGTIDMAFIDADKTNYDGYFEHCLRLVRPGGLIAIDNTLWGGSVADPADDRPDTVALKALNAKLAADERITVSLLPIGDGLTLALKRHP
ncbi:MAG: hypothetical protein RLY86_1832 [Pseudomonadota bacterium]